MQKENRLIIKNLKLNFGTSEARLIFAEELAVIPDEIQPPQPEEKDSAKAEYKCRIDEEKEECSKRLNLLDLEKNKDAKGMLEAYKELSKKEGKNKLAMKMNIRQIDVTGKIPEGREFLWEFFGGKGGVTHFYGNRELHRLVGLGEITPDKIQHLKVDGVVVKRVHGLRDYFENKRGRYVKIIENTQVDTNVSQDEIAQAGKFPSDGKDIRSEQLNTLEKTNPDLAKQIREKKADISKDEFYGTLTDQGIIGTDLFFPEKFKIARVKWQEVLNDVLKKDKENKFYTPEQLLNELFSNYIELIKQVDEKDLTPIQKELIIKQTGELKEHILGLRNSNEKLFLNMLKGIKEGIVSPFSFDINLLKEHGEKIINKYSLFDRDHLRNIVKQKESSGNYQHPGNQYGYIGAYQAGAEWLCDLGYVKRGVTNSGLNNPNNWENGWSKEKFLNSPDEQDRAMDMSMDLSINHFYNQGLDDYLGKNIDGVQITLPGYIMAKHLGGGKNADNFVRHGNDFKDGNGTSIIKYFRFGNEAISQIS